MEGKKKDDEIHFELCKKDSANPTFLFSRLPISIFLI